MKKSFPFERCDLCVLSLLKTHNTLEMYNCIRTVIHGIQGTLLKKKTKQKTSVPIFTSQCAEMHSD